MLILFAQIFNVFLLVLLLLLLLLCAFSSSSSAPSRPLPSILPFLALLPLHEYEAPHKSEVWQRRSKSLTVAMSISWPLEIYTVWARGCRGKRIPHTSTSGRVGPVLGQLGLGLKISCERTKGRVHGFIGFQTQVGLKPSQTPPGVRWVTNRTPGSSHHSSRSIRLQPGLCIACFETLYNTATSKC